MLRTKKDSQLGRMDKYSRGELVVDDARTWDTITYSMRLDYEHMC